MLIYYNLYRINIIEKKKKRLTQGYNQRYKYKIKELNVDELIEGKANHQ